MVYGFADFLNGAHFFCLFADYLIFLSMVYCLTLGLFVLSLRSLLFLNIYFSFLVLLFLQFYVVFASHLHLLPNHGDD